MKVSKQFIFFLSLFLILISGFYFFKQNNQSMAVDSTPPHPLINNTPLLKDREIFAFPKPLSNIELQAEAALLINAENGDILYEKNTEEALPIASMSKMMTELIILEAIDEGKVSWDDTVTVSDYAFTISHHPGFASVLLNQDKNYTIRELFLAMAIRSANGATIALAEAVHGTEKDFVEKMNEKAQQLGLQNSNFVNTTGLGNEYLGEYYSVGSPNDSNIMSARDVITLATYLIDQFPNILDIAKTPQIDFHQETYINTNLMLPDLVGKSMEYFGLDLSYEGIDGLKTGFTNEAGYCFTGTVEIGDMRFISVIMGSNNSEDRFIETKQLYEAIKEQINN